MSQTTESRELTPGTRSGIVHDEAYIALLNALVPLEEKLIEMMEEPRRAEEDADWTKRSESVTWVTREVAAKKAAPSARKSAL
jgi:hypothetical protein